MWQPDTWKQWKFTSALQNFCPTVQLAVFYHKIAKETRSRRLCFTFCAWVDIVIFLWYVNSYCHGNKLLVLVLFAWILASVNISRP